MTNQDTLVERTVAGLHASLVRHLPPPSEVRSLLDVGCGTGAWLARLRREGYSGLLGVDLETSQFAATGIRCLPGNLDHAELPLEPRSIDLMTAIELVEHLHNPGRLFFHAERLLSPNGMLLVTTPNVESVLARLRFLLTGKLKQFDDKGDPTHVTPIFETCLRRIVAGYGLAITDAWGFPESGRSQTSRPSLDALAGIARMFLAESRGGDIACFCIRHAPRPD